MRVEFPRRHPSVGHNHRGDLLTRPKGQTVRAKWLTMTLGLSA